MKTVVKFIAIWFFSIASVAFAPVLLLLGFGVKVQIKKENK